ncbi:MAG: diguanylate cyclase [Bacillota bacterium]
MVFVFYFKFLNADSPVSLLMALKYGLNGIVNGLVANMLIYFGLSGEPVAVDGKNSSVVRFGNIIYILGIISIILPVLIVVVISGRQEFHRLVADTESRLEDNSSRIAESLQLWRQQHLQAVTSLARVASVYGTNPNWLLQKSTELLTVSNPGFYNMYVANREGTATASFPLTSGSGKKTVGLNFSGRRYFNDLKSTLEPVVSNVFEDREVGPGAVIAVSVPVVNGGRFQGFACGTLDLTEMGNYLRMLSAGGNSGITVVDQENKIIASTSSDLAPLQQFEHKKETGRLADMISGIPAGAGKPVFEQWKDSFIYHENTIAETFPWKVVLEEPVAPYIDYLYGFYIRNLAVLLIITLLTMPAAEYAGRKLLGPLSKYIEPVGENSDMQAGRGTVGVTDRSVLELDALVKSFRSMSNELSQSFTNMKKANEAFRDMAFNDPLTGLYNRLYFEEKIKYFDRPEYAPVGIIVCDIDGLKLVNDTVGHDSGDGMLVAMADIFRDSLRGDDVIARIGGDELGAILPNIDNVTLKNICCRIRNAVVKYNAGNPDLPLSISMGSSLMKGEFQKLEEVFRAADNNMYREKLHRGQSARSAIVHTLMSTLKARDYITEGHADRLQGLLTGLARAVFPTEDREADLVLFAQFHDIGKVGLPDRILFKPGPLTSGEMEEMRKHCEIGHNIAQSSPDLVPIADWILKHHEWWNGKGYPIGLAEEEIPLECRILAIVDAYDAMTSDRPYRKAMSRKDALLEIKRCAGTQFDPGLAQKFINLFEDHVV